MDFSRKKLASVEVDLKRLQMNMKLHAHYISDDHRTLLPLTEEVAPQKNHRIKTYLNKPNEIGWLLNNQSIIFLFCFLLIIDVNQWLVSLDGYSILRRQDEADSACHRVVYVSAEVEANWTESESFRRMTDPKWRTCNTFLREYIIRQNWLDGNKTYIDETWG